MGTGKKSSNRRVYPDANHQPRQKAAERIGRAQARNEANAALTLEQKIAKLPPEPHAKKERARLLAQLEAKKVRAVAKETAKKSEENVSPQEQTTEKPKKYLKGQK
jgi:hypothetical protein